MLFCFQSYSQSECNILLGKVNFYPFSNSIIYGHFTCESVVPDDKYKVFACSKDSEVISMTSGTVLAILEIDHNYKTVLVKGSKYSYAYTFFDTIFVKNGEQIEKGQILGKSEKSKTSNLYEIEIGVLNSKSDFLNENDIWQLIEEANSIPIAAVCDTTVLN
jgi:hypothetical protein